MKGFSLAEALSHNARRKNTNPTRLIVSSFLAVILCGTLLLMLPVSNRDGQMLDMLDAMFTATSATCVTGLVVFDTYTQFSTFGQVVILLIQVGGLGLVTLTTFFNIAVGRRLGFKSLRLASESINLSDASQARALLQFVMKVAFVFEAIGAALLALVFVPQFGADGIFISVFISISSCCTAGLDGFAGVVPQRYSLSEQSVRFGCYFTAHHQRRTGLSCLAGPFGLPPYTPPAHTHKAGFVDHWLAAPAGHCGHPVHGV